MEYIPKGSNITNRKPNDDVKRQTDSRNPLQDISKDNATHETSSDDVGEDSPPANLAEAIRARFAPLGGLELELPPRGPMRDPPDFE